MSFERLDQRCPKCGSNNCVREYRRDDINGNYYEDICDDCGEML